MVVGGEVVTLKHVEESTSLVIAEMPINVSFLLTLCSFIYALEHSF
jgi:translation initiation factor 4A